MSTTAVKERPILFSTQMVRALLEGRKTQTRRVIKPQPPESISTLVVERFHPTVVDRDGEEVPGDEIFGACDLDGQWGRECPYGQPGDLLWVRETWLPRFGNRGALYKADYHEIEAAGVAGLYSDKGWKPSIFMPRWACRIALEIEQVRAQRLQEINWIDCLAEGFGPAPGAHPVKSRETDGDRSRCVKAFLSKWDALNAKRGFPSSSNPWVWALTFRVLSQ